MASQTKSLRLKFSTGVISSPVFTGQMLKGDKRGGEGGDESIEVSLVDSQTGQKVSFGPVASARLQIVLVHKNFPSNQDWTTLEFKNNIVTELKNKKNPLQGDVALVLEHGSGVIGDIRIKHDRNYLSKVKLRLGAMVVDNIDGFTIKEAITDPFEIKDRRNILYKKSHQLLPTDKVYKLKNIGKRGPRCKRLEDGNVETVRDFVNMLSLNPQALQKLYGCNGRNWETTVRHAQTCNMQANGSDNLNIESNDHPINPYEGASWQVDYKLISDPYADIGDGEYATNLEPWFHEYLNQFYASTSMGDLWAGRCDKAQRRWAKLCRMWFSMKSFTKKVRGCLPANSHQYIAAA